MHKHNTLRLLLAWLNCAWILFCKPFPLTFLSGKLTLERCNEPSDFGLVVEQGVTLCRVHSPALSYTQLCFLIQRMTSAPARAARGKAATLSLALKKLKCLWNSKDLLCDKHLTLLVIILSPVPPAQQLHRQVLTRLLAFLFLPALHAGSASPPQSPPSLGVSCWLLKCLLSPAQTLLFMSFQLLSEIRHTRSCGTS